MNRHERRAAKRTGTAQHQCSDENLIRAIATAQAVGQPGIAQLLRDVMAQKITLAVVKYRDAVLTDTNFPETGLPLVCVVGDDDYASTGPAGWACAATVAAWAACAVVHGAGSSTETYGEATRAAEALGSCALIETDAKHAIAWSELFIGKPALIIIPPEGGMHPMTPKPEARH